MALSNTITALSYTELLVDLALDESNAEHADKIKLLKEVNQLAALDNIFLSRQGEYLLSVLKKALAEAKHTPIDVLKRVKNAELDDIKKHNALNAAAGTFDNIPLHNRNLSDQLQDHDVLRFMPKSFQHIEVLAATRTDMIANEVLIDGIKHALANPMIQHIMFAVGPGHYRGVYLTKADATRQHYELELFGPFGPSDAVVIKDLVLIWLKQAGIKQDSIHLTLTGPKHLQTDGYSCGDYTCAHSNKKMKEWGAPQSMYDARLIQGLEQQGNTNHALRQLLRAISENPMYAMATTAVPLSTVQNKSDSTTETNALIDALRIYSLDKINFNYYLDLLKANGEHLKAKGHTAAGAEAFHLYNLLKGLKTQFTAPSSPMTYEEFINRGLELIKNAKKEHLEQHRGAKLIINGLLNMLIGLANSLVAIGNLFNGDFKPIDYNQIATQSKKDVGNIQHSLTALLAIKTREQHQAESPGKNETLDTIRPVKNS